MYKTLLAVALFFKFTSAFASAGAGDDAEYEKLGAPVATTYTSINTNWRYPPVDKDGRYALISGSAVWMPVRVKETIASAQGDPIEDTIFSLALDKTKLSICKKGKPLKTKTGVFVRNFGAAFDNLIQSKSHLDCTIAQNAVKIMCVRTLLGDETFNVFSTLVYDRMEKAKTPDRFFFMLTTYFWQLTKDGKSRVGDTAYITNIAPYSHHKPMMHDQGHCLMHVAPDRFMGFSQDLFAKGPQSSQAVEDVLYHAFISPEGVTQDADAHSDLVRLYTASRVAYDSARRETQKQYSDVYRINLDQIAQFKRAKALPY